MKWYRKLYLVKSLPHKRGYYKFLVEKTRRYAGMYCILLSPHPGCLLDICRCEMLRSPQLFQMGDMVVGMAGSRKESRELAGQMILDALAATGSADVRAFVRMQEAHDKGKG